jgi:hypothetical protein
MAIHRLAAASGLFAAAVAWPSAVRSLTQLTMTPLERAMQTSWCGPPPEESLTFLGHCAVCFAGAAVLAASGLVVLIADEGVRGRMRAPASAWRGRASL